MINTKPAQKLTEVVKGNSDSGGSSHDIENEEKIKNRSRNMLWRIASQTKNGTR